MRSSRGGATLRTPAYRRLLASTLAGYGARFLDMTVLSWLVVQRTEDPLPIGLLGFFRFVPFLLAGPVVGLAADHFPRLWVLRGAQAALAALALVMAGLLSVGAVEVWHAYVYALCQGFLFLLDSTSRRAYLARTVGSALVTAALSIDMLGMTVARIVFANAAGALLEASQPRWAYLVLAAMAAVSIACTRGLPTLFRAGEETDREPLAARLQGGLRFARSHPPILGGLVLVALANLTCFVYEPMIPVVADEVFHAGPVLFGLFLSATGVGSLITTLWMSLGGVSLSRPGWVALVAAAVIHVLQVLFSYAGTLAASISALIVIGAVGTVFSIAHSSLFLVATPDALRGRVLGLQTLMIGTYPVSNLIVGWLGNHLGALAAVRWMAFAGIVWVVLLAILLPALRQPIEAPDDPETLPASPESTTPRRDAAWPPGMDDRRASA